MNEKDILELAKSKKEEKNKKNEKIKLPNARKMMREYDKEQKELLKLKKPLIEEATNKAKVEFVVLLKAIEEITKRFSINDFKFDDDKKGIHVRKIYNGEFIGIINNMYFRTVKKGNETIIETYMARRLPVELKVNQPIEERHMYYKSVGVIKNGEIDKFALNVSSFVDIYDSYYMSKDDRGIQFHTKEYRNIKDNILYYLHDKYSLKTIPFNNNEIIPQTKYIKNNNNKQR